MSFEELVPVAAKAAKSAPVRIGVRAIKNSAAPSRLTLLIAAEVLDQLGGALRRYRVALGKAENKHELKIVADDGEGLFQAHEVKARGAGGVFRLLLPPNDRWPVCKIALQETIFQLTKAKALLVTLPAWAWDEKKTKAAVEARARE